MRDNLLALGIGIILGLMLVHALVELLNYVFAI